MEVLIINGHDYTRYIQSKGLAWKRSDLDSSKTTRTKDGLMRRDKVTTKRTAAYTLMPAPRETLAQLDDDLSENTFTATYMDLHGQQTRTFYCSSFECTLDAAYDEEGMWSGGKFNMIEV